MGRFEQRVRRNMQDPAYADGFIEAEREISSRFILSSFASGFVRLSAPGTSTGMTDSATVEFSQWSVPVGTPLEPTAA